MLYGQLRYNPAVTLKKRDTGLTACCNSRPRAATAQFAAFLLAPFMAVLMGGRKPCRFRSASCPVCQPISTAAQFDS